MALPKFLSDAAFMSEFQALGATGLAKKYKMDVRGVHRRRRGLEARADTVLVAPSSRILELEAKYPHRLQNDIKNGVVLIGSDFHLWPGQNSTALRAFKKFADDLRPTLVILNGDVLDFPQISRHPPIGWESTPSPKEEVEAAQDHLHDIAQACKRARKVWTLGNHDARFETRLATVASEYRGLKGIHLSDFFPQWEKGWSCWINADHEQSRTVVKHRQRGGIHATYNNTLHGGVTTVTGHLHSAVVRAFTDYRGTRWGVDTGCCADTDAKQFTDYTEDGPKNWISGFGVLTFKDGNLLWPELVTKYGENRVQFRGQVIKV